MSTRRVDMRPLYHNNHKKVDIQGIYREGRGRRGPGI